VGTAQFDVKSMGPICHGHHSYLPLRAMLAAMYGAGLRVSEVVGLKVSDLDRERHVIWVRGGKGHKDRQVMLAEPLREVLAAYWRWKRPTDWPSSSRCVANAWRSECG